MYSLLKPMFMTSRLCCYWKFILHVAWLGQLPNRLGADKVEKLVNVYNLPIRSQS